MSTLRPLTSRTAAERGNLKPGEVAYALPGYEIELICAADV